MLTGEVHRRRCWRRGRRRSRGKRYTTRRATRSCWRGCARPTAGPSRDGLLYAGHMPEPCELGQSEYYCAPEKLPRIPPRVPSESSPAAPNVPFT